MARHAGLVTAADSYKAHVATDQDATLIEAVEVTTANIHDSALLDMVLPPDPGDVNGASAFAGRMCWLGLTKAGLQLRLTAIAYNPRRSHGILFASPA
jgi:hypothetical protein